MEPFCETLSEMDVLERVEGGVKYSELSASQRQRGQTKGCTKQKVASAAAQSSPRGDKGCQEEPQLQKKAEGENGEN